MKIIKVVVDELPTGCDKCTLTNHEWAVCGVTKKPVWEGNEHQDWLLEHRPAWCPLVKDEQFSLQ